jgi:hypothetical protein
MDCAKCKSKALIKASYPKVVNGDTPDKPTELYEVIDFACLNDKCEMFNTVIDTQMIKREL